MLHPDANGPELDLSSQWLTWGTYGDDYFPTLFNATGDMAGAKVAGEIVERALMALDAGCDMLPICNDRESVIKLLAGLPVKPRKLASARLQIGGFKATYHQQLADLESAKDSVGFDEREYGRKKALVASDWTPRSVYDRTETDLKVARDHVASVEQQIANTVVALNGDPNIEIDRHPTVRAAQA